MVGCCGRLSSARLKEQSVGMIQSSNKRGRYGLKKNLTVPVKIRTLRTVTIMITL